jgi:hemoglobin/transferrin/lactoferrin receptor protein
LKPENAYTIDLGFNRYNKALSYSINFYYTLLNRTIGRDLFYDYTDLTTENPTTVLYDNEEVITMGNYNLGNSNIYGFNFDTNYSFNEYFNLIGNLTFTNGDIVYNDYPMPSIPPLFGSVKLRFKKNNFNLQLTYKFSQSKSADQYSFGGEDGLDETPFIYENKEIKYLGMPKWGIFQLSSLFNITKEIKAQLLLDNIFDIHYREFASGISSPGRSLNLMLIFD